MVLVPGGRHPRSMDDILAEIRSKLADRGEPDDYSDEELRDALRITLLALAIEHGGENEPQQP